MSANSAYTKRRKTASPFLEHLKILHTSRRDVYKRQEVEHAVEEGIIFKTLSNPVEVVGDADGSVCGMRCVEMELGEPDASGRRRTGRRAYLRFHARPLHSRTGSVSYTHLDVYKRQGYSLCWCRKNPPAQ